MPADRENTRWEQFGSWLRKMRRDADLTQAQVAKRAGIHEVQVARIEKGESGTKRETVIQLAQAIGVDVGDALMNAGFSLTEDELGKYRWGKPTVPIFDPPRTKKPKDFIEFIEALETLGIQIDYAVMDTAKLQEYSPDELAELMERIKADVEITVRRKTK
jgi:transcriptional regulator with XRE-family HTH domain